MLEKWPKIRDIDQAQEMDDADWKDFDFKKPETLKGMRFPAPKKKDTKGLLELRGFLKQLEATYGKGRGQPKLESADVLYAKRETLGLGATSETPSEVSHPSTL